MKKRNFFTYTFTLRVFAIWLLLTTTVAAALWACNNLLHWYSLSNAIAAVYSIFCALFLFKSVVDYRKYRKF